ncbi:MAG: response regulator transcription factor [Methylobacterium sp.]|nr:response regulator transcription factor [Methylobacterium sp.]MCA3623778.1 response regulator transcription factor [Methylobacterium sp.]MCA4909692.1 response regulator transcription factor [Methylobacterium sp.]
MRPMNILIVDDHPLVRVGLRTALQCAFPGVAIEECAALAEARGRLLAGPLDAVILDLALPDSSGTETYLALQHLCPGLPVIVVTGSDPRDLLASPALEGAAGVLSKADGPEAILSALGELTSCEPETLNGTNRPVLTPRERDILVLCARGLQNKVIGRSLGISENTVRAHLASVFKRFGLAHRGAVKDFLERARIG